MSWLISIVMGLFSGVKGGSPATQATGLFNSLATWSAIGAGFLWLLGPGRNMKFELNLLELAGISLAVSFLIGMAQHQSPPAPRYGPPGY